jgi:hypothetical protein
MHSTLRCLHPEILGVGVHLEGVARHFPLQVLFFRVGNFVAQLRHDLQILLGLLFDGGQLCLLISLQVLVVGHRSVVPLKRLHHPLDLVLLPGKLAPVEAVLVSLECVGVHVTNGDLYGDMVFLELTQEAQIIFLSGGWFEEVLLSPIDVIVDNLVLECQVGPAILIF